VQPATVQDALQVGQVGALVVVDEQEVELPGCEAVLGAQRVERSAAVTDGADDAGDPVGDAGLRPDTLRPSALAAERSTENTLADGAARAIRSEL